MANRGGASPHVARPRNPDHQRAEHELGGRGRSRTEQVANTGHHREHEQRHGQRERERRVAYEAADITPACGLERGQPRLAGAFARRERIDDVRGDFVAGVADRGGRACRADHVGVERDASAR